MEMSMKIEKIINKKIINLRPKQKLPTNKDYWTTFLICGGRGFGKTTAGAYNLNELVMSGKYKNIGIVGASIYDVRNIMYENHLSQINPEIRYYHSKKTLVWPNGTVARLFGGAHYNTIRGYEFDLVWIDEFAKIPKCEELWKQINFSLRVKGENGHSKIIITTTPHGKTSSRKLLEKIARHPKTFLVTGSSYENKDNLSETFLENIQEYEGTAEGETEIHGRMISSNQLWNMEDIQYVDNVKINVNNTEKSESYIHVLEDHIDSCNTIPLEEKCNNEQLFDNKKNENINENNNDIKNCKFNNHVDNRNKKEEIFYESNRCFENNIAVPASVHNDRGNYKLQKLLLSQNIYKSRKGGDENGQQLKKSIDKYSKSLMKKIFIYLNKYNLMGEDPSFIAKFCKNICRNSLYRKYANFNVNKSFIRELINKSFVIYTQKNFSKKNLEEFISEELFKRINNYFLNKKVVKIETEKIEEEFKYSKEEALIKFCKKEINKDYINYKEDVLNKINNLNFDNLSIDEYAIGVDPAFGGNSEIGIILTGITKENKYIVLDDFSGYYEPPVWHFIVVNLAMKFNGTVVLETNHGGEVLSSLFAGLKLQTERANDNKYNRSIPCYMMYHKREVYHYKQFHALEEQMLHFNEVRRKDRLDALVWAFKFLKSRYTPSYWQY